MSVKKYISKSCLSINVVLPSGKSSHVAFSPLTGGGSVLYTDSEDIQFGLRNHRMYGKAFKESEIQEVKAIEPSEAAAAADSSEGTTIVVKSLDEAKDYLCEHYGMSRTKLKGVDGTKKAASTVSITFEGI